MNKNRYNFNDNEYENIKKLLKELPKEKAADNFEYNLMVRINNGNFERDNYKEQKYSLWKIFIPVTGVVTAVFLYFFIFNFAEENTENIFQTIPQLRTEISGNLNVPISLTKNIFGKHKITKQDVVLIEPKITDKSEKPIPAQKPKTKIYKHQGMAALPFKINNSTNLDAVVQNNRTAHSRTNRRAKLAGMNNGSAFYGFFLGQELNRKEVEAMKARIDSIKKYSRIKR